MILTKRGRRLVAVASTLVFVALSCCAVARCDDEKEKSQGKPEPITVKIIKDDVRLWQFAAPDWEKYLNDDDTEYSVSVRSQIKKLPKSNYLITEALEPKAEQLSAIFTNAFLPNSPNHIPWLFNWIMESIPEDLRGSLDDDGYKLLCALGLMLSPQEFVSYCSNSIKAINSLPDEVPWKKDLAREFEGYLFVWQFEKSTFNLYEVEKRMEEFVDSPTPALALSISGTLSLASALDEQYDFLKRLPQSRFARLFPKRLKDAADILKNKDVVEWEKNNKDKKIGDDNGKTVTVGDAFNKLRKIVEKYDSIIK